MSNLARVTILFILLSCLTHVCAAASPFDPSIRPPASLWGDLGDGTYANPVLPGDYSDIDVIRVGDDFYAMSSTFQFSPGVVILHSKDLVNWRIIGHAVDDMTQISPEMNWDRMARYGNGIWAGSIRFHEGKYWIYFGTPNDGYFMTTASNPAGPWTPLSQIMQASGYDDCCPFWDDDGQGYLVGSQFSKDQVNGKRYNIHLWKLTADGKGLVPGSDTIIHQSEGSEANKFYKINGLYYHYYSEVKKEGRVAMMNRASSLSGPWSTKQLNHARPVDPNQGGLIELASGQWWFFTQFGSGYWPGRQANLLPVTWIDGWPIIGTPDQDHIGVMVWQARKPIAGFPVTVPQTDDEFNDPKLSVQWEWNYQPRADKWSLGERPGYLRLHAFKSLDGDNLKKVGNVLTQRAMCAAGSVATVKLDLSGMVDGQRAGFCHFAGTYSMIGVAQSGSVRTLIHDDNGKITDGPTLTAGTLWLRSSWDCNGVSQYAYSLDGTTFIPFGKPYQLTWGAYRGDRIGIVTYNNRGDNGWLDVDWFHYKYPLPSAARVKPEVK